MRNKALEIHKQSKDLLDRSYVSMGLKPVYKIKTASTKGVKLNNNGLH